MRVSVFGSGYIGLVQAAVFADAGHQVCCMDIDAARIVALQAGEVPLHEPGLAALLQRTTATGDLHFTSAAADAVSWADVLFLAVGTPSTTDGAADLSAVQAVAEQIGRHMQSDKLVVNKSTVPVGSADRVTAIISQELAGRDAQWQVQVASNPEFLKEGSAVDDCQRPDRIVLGTDSPAAEATLRELYAPFNRNHEKILVMDTRSAELTKYAANAMLATKISFMNEMATLAERLGADIECIRRGIGSDPRIGYHFIYAGCGYGGACFPKDIKALIATATEVNYQAPLLRAVEHINQAQKQVLFERLQQHFSGDLRGRTVALWGLAFKPNTDDMREAPSLVLLESLWGAGVK